MTVTEDLEAGLARSAESLWVPPAGGFFEGRWQNGRRHLHVYDPEDGSLVGVSLDASDAEVDRAVRFVAAGHAKVHWPLWQRREALEAAADKLSDATELFTVLIAAEGCKTATEAAREIARAVEVLRLCAQLSSLLTGRTVPFDDTPRGAGWRGWFTREPVGVVAAITPFNDPLNLVVHKLGPALIAGNAVVLKPAPATPLTALAFGQILLASGVPGELLAILPGTEAGRALVSHPLVDVVSFTGGSATADHIAQSGRARKLMMELGGNNAVLVCADADVDEVAEAIVDGAFGVAGQNCLSVQRVIVHASRYDDLVEQVTKRASALVVGSKQDPRTDLGPLINQTEARRVVDWVHQAVLAGGRLRTGASLDGSFVTPAVLTDVPGDARVWTDEVFGPVVVIRPYVDLDEAVDAVNAVDTGLQAGVFTSDIDRALDIADRLRVGAVLINSTSDFRIDAMPFGGFKRSGIGREGVESSILSLSEPKVVAIKSRRAG